MPSYNIPFPNSPIAGENGYITREWFLFLSSLFQSVGGPNVVPGGGIEPMEVQKQFDGSPTSSLDALNAIRGIDELRNLIEQPSASAIKELTNSIDELRNELLNSKSDIQNLRSLIDQLESFTAGNISPIALVSSVNSKTGNVVLTVSDISGAAALAGASFTGNISAPNITISGLVTANQLLTGTNSAVANTGVATTVYALPNQAVSMYLVSANIGSVADVNNYSSFAVIATDGAVARILLSNNATLLTISLSGLNVQVTQSSGATKTAFVNITRIG